MSEELTDVVELCAILQCLGFNVKSLDTSDANMSQDGGVRTVVINCQSSGLHVVLESGNVACSCPTVGENSSFWQASGVTGGRQQDKGSGSVLLGTIPAAHRERLSRELREMVKYIKEHNESDVERVKDGTSKSASMIEVKTPEKRHKEIKAETPTRYRSLDTLTGAKNDKNQPLPAPGMLQKHFEDPAEDGPFKAGMGRRQSTYTLSSTPGSSIRLRNKTSSPIHAQQNNLLDHLLAAEKVADELKAKLGSIIRDFVDDVRLDSSMSSLALDVSKISVLKVSEVSKAQFASSPNLSGLPMVNEERPKIRLMRVGSASTSNLEPKKSTPKAEKTSRLRKLSPGLFKLRKDSPGGPSPKVQGQEKNTSRLNSLFRAKVVTPVRTPKTLPEASPILSGSKKKYSHIKSTIPRPASMKKE